jgi:hypothetical protein
MKIAKPNGPAEISKSSESEPTASNDSFRQSDGDMEASGLGSLVRQVSAASRREISNLVGELQTLDKKLQSENSGLTSAIVAGSEPK